jgi:hypothetical protein
MNREDIIRMAREAGKTQSGVEYTMPFEVLERFAALVAAAERKECDQLLEHIRGWVEAYPLSIFPEPDFGKAHKVLTENGMTLDAISASIMRHVITQVKEMVDAAIRARRQG